MSAIGLDGFVARNRSEKFVKVLAGHRDVVITGWNRSSDGFQIGAVSAEQSLAGTCVRFKVEEEGAVVCQLGMAQVANLFVGGPLACEEHRIGSGKRPPDIFLRNVKRRRKDDYALKLLLDAGQVLSHVRVCVTPCAAPEDHRKLPAYPIQIQKAHFPVVDVRQKSPRTRMDQVVTHVSEGSNQGDVCRARERTDQFLPAGLQVGSLASQGRLLYRVYRVLLMRYWEAGFRYRNHSPKPVPRRHLLGAPNINGTGDVNLKVITRGPHGDDFRYRVIRTAHAGKGNHQVVTWGDT